MKKITNRDDIKDIITGNIDLIKSVKYYTHTEPDNKIEPELDVEDTAITARIQSSQLATLKSGQLCCEIELASEDSEFEDSEDNTIIKDELAIWLV